MPLIVSRRQRFIADNKILTVVSRSKASVSRSGRGRSW